jgi:hypothetical protein
MTEQGDLFGPSQAGQAPSDVERSLLSDLLERSRLYHTSKDYLDLLGFVARLRNFAPFNAMLLQIQRPGLDYAASEYDWRTRFNRTIKEGARPHRGINVKLIDSGDANAGRIEAKRRSTAKKERPDYQVRLNQNHDSNVQFVTLVHELGHLYLGHLGPDKHLSIDQRPKIDQPQRELEAESLAYLVCKRRGVQSKSESYLADYVKANVTVGSFDFYLLTKAAGQVETALGIAAHTLFEHRV